MVPVAPKGTLPVMEVTGLPGEVALDVVHEPGEMPGIFGAEQAVPVVREEGDGVDPNVVETLRL